MLCFPHFIRPYLYILSLFIPNTSQSMDQFLERQLENIEAISEEILINHAATLFSKSKNETKQKQLLERTDALTPKQKQNAFSRNSCLFFSSAESESVALEIMRQIKKTPKPAAVLFSCPEYDFTLHQEPQTEKQSWFHFFVDGNNAPHYHPYSMETVGAYAFCSSNNQNLQQKILSSIATSSQEHLEDWVLDEAHIYFIFARSEIVQETILRTLQSAPKNWLIKFLHQHLADLFIGATTQNIQKKIIGLINQIEEQKKAQCINSTDFRLIPAALVFIEEAEDQAAFFSLFSTISSKRHKHPLFCNKKSKVSKKLRSYAKSSEVQTYIDRIIKNSQSQLKEKTRNWQQYTRKNNLHKRGEAIGISSNNQIATHYSYSF